MNDDEVKVEIIDDTELFAVAEDKVEKRRSRRKQTTPQRWNQTGEEPAAEHEPVNEEDEDDFYVGVPPPSKMVRTRPEVTSVESLCPSRPREIQPRLNLATKEKEARLDMANENNVKFSKDCITILTPTALPNGQTIYNLVRSPIMSKQLVKCPECIYVFNSTASCEAHMKKAHAKRRKQLMPKQPAVTYKCSDCPYVFNNAVDCNAHMKKAHPSNQHKVWAAVSVAGPKQTTNWSCPKCKLNIVGPPVDRHAGATRDTIHTYIKRHLENHTIMSRTKAPLYCCAVCHKSFVKKKTLDMHMTDVHISP